MCRLSWASGPARWVVGVGVGLGMGVGVGGIVGGAVCVVEVVLACVAMGGEQHKGLYTGRPWARGVPGAHQRVSRCTPPLDETAVSLLP